MERICFQMLALGHSIRNGSAGNVLTGNYAVIKECGCILSRKWLCNSKREVYIKKWATKHMKQVLKCQEQTISELDNCIFNFDVKVAYDEPFWLLV